MLGIGGGELVVIVILALLIVGPERLPVMIRDGTRWLRDLRRLVESTRRDLSESIGPELQDLGLRELQDLRDLDPRQYVRRHVLEGLDDEDRPNGSTSQRRESAATRTPDGRAGGSARRSGAADSPPAFDPDTT